MKRVLLGFVFALCTLAGAGAQEQPSNNDVPGGVSVETIQEAVKAVLAVDSDSMESEDIVGIVAIVVVFLTPILILLVALLFSYLKKRKRYDVMVRAIDKGMDLPKEFFDEGDSKRTLLQKGIVQVLVGIVLVLAIAFTVDGSAFVWGFILVALGAGNVLAHYLDKGQKTQNGE